MPRAADTRRLRSRLRGTGLRRDCDAREPSRDDASRTRPRRGLACAQRASARVAGQAELCSAVNPERMDPSPLDTAHGTGLRRDCDAREPSRDDASRTRPRRGLACAQRASARVAGQAELCSAVNPERMDPSPLDTAHGTGLRRDCDAREPSRDDASRTRPRRGLACAQRASARVAGQAELCSADNPKGWSRRPLVGPESFGLGSAALDSCTTAVRGSHQGMMQAGQDRVEVLPARSELQLA